MKKNTLIIFDIDGTLVDSLSVYHQVIVKAMNDMGIAKVDTNFDALKHHTDSYALKFNYEQNFTADFRSSLLDDFEGLILNYLLQYPKATPIKGAKEVVTQLQQNGYAIAFATGSLPKSALLKMNQADIWINEQVLATSMTSYDREGFVLDAVERAKKYYKVNSFDSIISIGDGIWDLKTAQNLNLEFIGIGTKNKVAMEANGMQHWFEDFGEFEIPLFQVK